jgi:nucleotide-binding universal stress UspA family protein
VNAQLSRSAEPTRRSSSPTIVVGVDGSESNASAIRWAAQEAAARRCRLVLSSACVAYAGTAGYDAWYPYKQVVDETCDALDKLRDHLCGDVPDVAVHVTTGGSLRTLLNEAEAGADLLVVGQRGAGAWSRLVIGSTSIALAGRSPVPVVVVPDVWAASQRSGPVVVGLPAKPGGLPVASAPLVQFAFEHADRLQVPLVAETAVQVPYLKAWSIKQVESWRQANEEESSRLLATWHDHFPAVEVVRHATVARPTEALLNTFETAQILVVGRHNGQPHIGGFSLGSTARAVLHRALVPVAIVPTPPILQSQKG